MSSSWRGDERRAAAYWTKLIAGGALNTWIVASVHPYRYTSAPEGIENDIAGIAKASCAAGERPDAADLGPTEVGWDLRRARPPVTS